MFNNKSEGQRAFNKKKHIYIMFHFYLFKNNIFFYVVGLGLRFQFDTSGVDAERKSAAV